MDNYMNKIKLHSRGLQCSMTRATVLMLAIGLHAANTWAGVGQVIDEETRKPLANVFVMAKWVGHANLGAIGKTICYDFAITQTDKNGRFSLRDRSWNFNPFLTDRERYVDFYLQGYEWSTSNVYDKSIGISDSGVIVISRYKGPVMTRLTWLATGRYAGCIPDHQTRSTLLPFYSARYEEAQSIAITVEEKQQALLVKQFRDYVGLEPGAIPRNPDGSTVK